MTQAAQTDKIKASLRTLGFSAVPDAGTLRSAARRLLMTVHPDTNRGWPQAEERTRAVIEALRFLEREAKTKPIPVPNGDPLYQTAEVGSMKVAWSVHALAGFTFVNDVIFLSQRDIEHRGRRYRLMDWNRESNSNGVCIVLFTNGSAIRLPELPRSPAMIRIKPVEIMSGASGSYIVRDGAAYFVIGSAAPDR
ncbi:MAG: hypothetical protein HY042_02975 [Spirochaetia bacterium]|nr:hypothetical protein [Spirochaetia bacterium]